MVAGASRFSKELPAIPQSPSHISLRSARTVPQNKLDYFLDNWKTKTRLGNFESDGLNRALTCKSSIDIRKAETPDVPPEAKSPAKLVDAVKRVYKKLKHKPKKSESSSANHSAADPSATKPFSIRQNHSAARSTPNLLARSSMASRIKPHSPDTVTSISSEEIMAKTPSATSKSSINGEAVSAKPKRPRTPKNKAKRTPIFFTVDEDWNSLEGEATCYFISASDVLQKIKKLEGDDLRSASTGTGTSKSSSEQDSSL